MTEGGTQIPLLSPPSEATTDAYRGCGVCLADLFPIVDIACPQHGLEAFMRETLAAVAAE